MMGIANKQVQATPDSAPDLRRSGANGKIDSRLCPPTLRPGAQATEASRPLRRPPRRPADRKNRRSSHVQPGAPVGIVAGGRPVRQRAALHAQARCVRPLDRVVPGDRERRCDRPEGAQGGEVRVRLHLAFIGLRGPAKLSRSPPSLLEGGPIVSCTPRRDSSRGST